MELEKTATCSHLADWTLSVAAIEKKKKFLAGQNIEPRATRYLVYTGDWVSFRFASLYAANTFKSHSHITQLP